MDQIEYGKFISLLSSFKRMQSNQVTSFVKIKCKQVINEKTRINDLQTETTVNH